MKHQISILKIEFRPKLEDETQMNAFCARLKSEVLIQENKLLMSFSKYEQVSL